MFPCALSAPSLVGRIRGFAIVAFALSGLSFGLLIFDDIEDLPLQGARGRHACSERAVSAALGEHGKTRQR